jgi:uncharacterized protein
LNGAVRHPVRTCVGCGQTAEQPELVRVKAEAGRVVVDHARTGGRGAWLHPAEACLDRALKRRSFARALRVEGVLADAGALRAEVTCSARKNRECTQ